MFARWIAWKIEGILILFVGFTFFLCFPELFSRSSLDLGDFDSFFGVGLWKWGNCLNSKFLSLCFDCKCCIASYYSNVNLIYSLWSQILMSNWFCPFFLMICFDFNFFLSGRRKFRCSFKKFFSTPDNLSNFEQRYQFQNIAFSYRKKESHKIK